MNLVKYITRLKDVQQVRENRKLGRGIRFWLSAVYK